MSTIVSNSNLVKGLEKRPSMSELGAQVASRANAMMASRSNVNVINITMESTQTNKRTASTNTTINNGHMADNIVVSESTTAVSAVSALASSQTTAAIVGDQVANNANNISINNIVMSTLPSSRISYVRRGTFYGALFDADHLATFPVGPKSGVMRAEDGIRKLRAMEKSQGIWRMECQLMIDARNVVVFDKKTGQEVEVFPIELVSDPTSVMSDDEQKDAAYTNIILFTVLEDHHPQRRRLRTNPTEMHLFQCARDVDSADMVDEIYKVKERKMIGDMDQQQQQQPRPDQITSQQATNLNSYTVTNIEHSRSLYRPVQQQQMQQIQQMPPPSSHHLQSTYPPQNMASENGYRKLIIPTQSADVNNNGGLMRHRATLMGAVVSQSPVPPQPQSHYQSNSVIPKPPQSVDFYPPPPPPPAPHPSSAHHLHNHQPLSLPPPAPHTMSQFQQHQQMSANRVEMEVQVLNHCFDDIECFVSRLQASIEVVRELEKRHLKQTQKGKNMTKSKKLKLIADEMQAIRAQLPQSHAFVDIFQKFKLSFNLLARLKLHIHNPNAPELVHVLFEPLATIVNAVNKELAWLIDTTEIAANVASSTSALGKTESGQPPITTTAGFTGSSSLKAMVKNVWSPMLTRDAKELMLNTLGSKEQDLWFTLGDAWMVSREEAKLQPHLYSANIDFNQHYAPVFYDGWAPNLSALVPTHPPEAYSVSYPSSYLPAQQQQPTAQDFSRLAYSAAAAAHQPQSVLKYGGARSSVDAGQSMNSTNNMPPPPPPNATSQQKRINFAVVDESTLSYNNYSSSRPLGNNNNNTTANTTSNRTRNGQNESNASTFSSSNKQPPQPQVPPQVSIRNYEEMKKWAVDLAYRGAKVYEVVQNRQANNDKELTIKSGELLEVLDDKRNWWKMRNFYGNTGYAPVTILRPFDLSSAMN